MADFMSNQQNSEHPPGPIEVQLTREPWSDVVVFHFLKTGRTEIMEPEAARQWFKMRGANMAVVEKALDDVWAWYGTRRPIILRIKNPRPIPQSAGLVKIP